MRTEGIKVFDEHTTRIETTAKYLCRGYTGSMTILLDRVKSDLSEMLAGYLNVDLTK